MDVARDALPQDAAFDELRLKDVPNGDRDQVSELTR